MNRTLLGILAAFAVALLVVGLTFSRTVDAPADFRFANGAEPKTLDPQLMTGEPEARLADAVFEGLTRRAPETLLPVPGAAESWEISPDGRRYAFHVRNLARWTDGRAVTARDFAYAWKRLLEPSLGSEYASALFAVHHAEALNTAAARARVLASAVPEAVTRLAREHPGGVPAARFQAFLAEHHVHDAVGREANVELAALLARRDGTVAALDLERFTALTKAVAGALLQAEAAARAHFGVDEGAFAADDHTFVVELDAPTPYFLQLTSFHSTFPAPEWAIAARAGHDDWFFPEHIVSNGPFRLERWLVNDRIRLTRSETYWGRDAVRLRTIDAYSLDNETTILNLYLTAALDWVPDYYPKDLARELQKRADFYAQPSMIVYFYRFNTSRPPFNDRRVRLAVNLAVDRTLLVEQVLGLGQLPATTLVPPGIPGYEPPESAIRYDVPRARALLAEAGYPNGKGFPAVGILYNTSGQHKKIAEEIAEELRRNLGIDVRAYNQEWQSYLATTRALDYDMARAGWVGDYVDPNTFLGMWVTNGGNNQTGFSSPLFDRLLRVAADVTAVVDSPGALLDELGRPEPLVQALLAARAATDPAARLAATTRARLLVLRAAESVLVKDELPVMPLFFYVSSGLVSPSVRGFHSRVTLPDGTSGPNLQDLHPLRDLSRASAGASGEQAR